MATHDPDPASPFQPDVREMVERTFGAWWSAFQHELPPRPPEPLPGIEHRYVITAVLDDTQLATRESEHKAQQRARRAAVDEADKCATAVVVDGRRFEGHLIRNADLWAMGFHCSNRGLLGIVSARGVKVEDLKLTFNLDRLAGNVSRPSQ